MAFLFFHQPSYKSESEVVTEDTAIVCPRCITECREMSIIQYFECSRSTLSIGMGYGGGRALDSVFMKNTPSQDAIDAAAASFENNDGLSPPPPPVNPHSCVAWYPTKFDLKAFTTTATNNKNVEDEKSTAVMAVFAGDDILLGATREDAALLNDVLGKNDAVKDHLVKVRYF